MTLVLRIATIAVALLIGAATVASANTMELTLTVPLKITLPTDSAAVNPALDKTTGKARLKDFDVNCVVGANLGYATGAGAQGTIVYGEHGNLGIENRLEPDRRHHRQPASYRHHHLR